MNWIRCSLGLVMVLCGGCAVSMESLTPQGAIAPSHEQAQVSPEQSVSGKLDAQNGTNSN